MPKTQQSKNTSMKPFEKRREELLSFKETMKKRSIIEAGRFMPIVIEGILPEIDGGSFAVKCVAGQEFQAEADIFKDGHDVIKAAVLYRRKGESSWQASPMLFLENDRWRGSFTPKENGMYEYTVEAWKDPLATWLRFMQKKCPAYPEVKTDLDEGIGYLREMEEKAKAPDRKKLEHLRRQLELSEGASAEVLRIIESPEFQDETGKFPLRRLSTPAGRILPLFVDRKKAEFSAWYEMFPRSQGKNKNKSGTFKDCTRRLPDIRKMGFDVIYLPPVHPIGITNRKGPNNTLNAGKNDPGSPWAIGAKEGGHKAIHPELGTLKDFRAFVDAAKDYGMEIALDIALQCSPDHPYVKDHPDWFYRLPDGTIRYAENPPKKYQDIYPLDFHCADWQNLWQEMRSIFFFWIEQGVKIFRVDNPHTKPLRFWHWVIDEVIREYPDVIFLSEAFTRPKMMKFLAKAGFTQSYTYFTWRNTKWELRQYLEELTQSEMKYYFRGNFFANTPDILTEYLQKDGKAAFKTRLVLAGTLSPAYGIYSGYEFCENVPLHEGSEEYLNSEKYEIRVRDWNSPDNIKDYIARINRIRRDNPALQSYTNLEFCSSMNDNILCYFKKTPDNSDIIVVVVNLDPFHTHEDQVSLPIWKFGIEDWQTYQMKDLITGEKYYWKGQTNYVRLDPYFEPAHIFRLKK